MKKTLLLISAIYLAGGGVTALANESAQTTISVEACGCIKVKPGHFQGPGGPHGCAFDYTSAEDWARKLKSNHLCYTYYWGGPYDGCNYTYYWNVSADENGLYAEPTYSGSCWHEDSESSN